MITLTAGTLALNPNLSTYFLASGGTGPYVYTVAPGGAGGTIDSVTGQYTAPNKTGVDTIVATDSLLAAGSIVIGVMNYLELFCDIIQNQMSLNNGRVYLWDQKIQQPKDSSLYVVVSVLSCKPFGSSVEYDTSQNQIQSVNMMTRLGIDAISRGPEARDRKEEIIMALMSQYSESQQEINSFNIARLSTAFVNLSDLDGAAIPYRFHIDVNIQYAVRKTQAPGPISYYDTFTNPPTPVIEP